MQETASTINAALKKGRRRNDRAEKSSGGGNDGDDASAESAELFINSYHHPVAQHLVHSNHRHRRASRQQPHLHDMRRTGAADAAVQKEPEGGKTQTTRTSSDEQRRQSLRAPPGFDRSSRTRSPLSMNSPPSVRRFLAPQTAALAPSWLKEKAKPKMVFNLGKQHKEDEHENPQAPAAVQRAHCSALYTPPDSPAGSPSSSWAHAQPGSLVNARQTEIK